MSKGLEALKENRKLVLFESVEKRAKYSDNSVIIEKELKALEIIKALGCVYLSENIAGDHSLFLMGDTYALTKDNYEILKGVFDET